ncbi:MAG: hypothetical protein JWN56_566 [Sphingobacteriales bacterium]|nr:hypothetical protein [Sphingobacteriales bacterium]
MNKLIIPSKINDKVLEEILLRLINTSKDLHLQLPQKIDYRGFGMLPKLLLVLFTWIRTKSGKIIIPIPESDEESLKNFSNNYFGYVTLLTVWKICDIENEEGISLKKCFRSHTKIFHNKIDFLEGLPLDAVLIPNFDHYSKVKGLSHWFYSPNSEFYEYPSSLNNSIFRIFQSLKVNLKTALRSPKILEDIQSIIWELIKNTHEHATNDWLNTTTLTPNTRGAYFRVQRSSKRNYITGANSHKGLIQFYEDVLNDGVNLLLEVSVFDSGPGLVKRYLGEKWIDNLNVREDVNIIKRCLIRGNTSVNTLRGVNKGFGLDHVLKLLSDNRGFLTIRTGRTSLYRDLNKSPYSSTIDIEKIELNDWTNCSSSQYVNMNATEGTMITMVYPLKDI